MSDTNVPNESNEEDIPKEAAYEDSYAPSIYTQSSGRKRTHKGSNWITKRDLHQVEAKQKRDPHEPKTANPDGKKKNRKGTPSIGRLSLPSSPSSFRSLVVRSGIAIKDCGFSHLLAAVSHLVDLANDTEYKEKRSKQNPALRDHRKSFEITKEETQRFIRRLNYKAPTQSKTTTLLAFLEKVGVITKLKAASNIPPSRGTTYHFTCRQFRTYDVEIDPKFIPQAKEKVSELIGDRSENEYTIIYKANLAQYRLSDEDLELLKDYTKKGDDGSIKSYGDIYTEIKKWDGKCTAKRGSYHSPYSRLPSYFRTLRKDSNGVHLALVDISSAHAVFLYKLLKEEIAKDKEKGKDICKDEYELGQFGKDIELRRLYTKFDKKPFLSLLNAYEEIDSVKDVASELAIEYPTIANRIRRTKRRNKNKLYHLLHRMLNTLMEEAVMICKEWGFNAMILGDELDVPEHQAERVKDLLLDLVFKYTRLESNIKITTRNGEQRFKYKSKCPCPTDLCPDCWDLNITHPIKSPFPCKHLK